MTTISEHIDNEIKRLRGRSDASRKQITEYEFQRDRYEGFAQTERAAIAENDEMIAHLESTRPKESPKWQVGDNFHLENENRNGVIQYIDDHIVRFTVDGTRSAYRDYFEKHATKGDV